MSGETLISFEPATGSEFWSGSVGDAAAEVAVARAAWPAWAAHSVTYRMETLRRWGFPLVVATAVVAVPLAAAAWFGVFGKPAAEDVTGAIERPVVLSVAGERLAVPGGLIRFVDQRRSGDHQRLDIAFEWPSLQPAPSARTSSTA